MPRGRRAPGPVRRPPGRERVNTMQGDSVQLDSAVNGPGVRPLSVGKGERIVGRDDLSPLLTESQRSFSLPRVGKRRRSCPQNEERIARRDHHQAAAGDAREPPRGLRGDRIEFCDKNGDEAAIAQGIQGDLAWLFGTVGDDAVRHGQLVTIGGGEYEIRRAGEFGRCGTRKIKNLEETLTVILAQLRRRPNGPVRCGRAGSERYTVRCQSPSVDL